MSAETEIEVIKTIVSKLDTSIEKLTHLSNDIGKILAVHEQRISSIEKTADNTSEEIKDIHSRITTQTREVVEKIDQLQSRLEHKMQANSVAAANQHDAIQKAVTEDIREIAKTLDHDIQELSTRVAMLEKWKWYVIGLVAGAGFILGHFGNLIK